MSEYFTEERWEAYRERRGDNGEFCNYNIPDYRFKRLLSTAQECLSGRNYWMSERDKIKIKYDNQVAFNKRLITKIKEKDAIIAKLKEALGEIDFCMSRVEYCKSTKPIIDRIIDWQKAMSKTMEELEQTEREE